MLMLKLIAVLVIKIIATNGLLNDTVTTTVDPSISWFLKYTPYIDLAKNPQISAKCRGDFQTFQTAMDNLELWALKSEKNSSLCR